MFDIRQILVSALALPALLALGACGQKGPLYLPTPPEGVQRPTLPQVIRSTITGNEPDTPHAGPPSQTTSTAPAPSTPASAARQQP